MVYLKSVLCVLEKNVYSTVMDGMFWKVHLVESVIQVHYFIVDFLSG